VKEEFVFDVRPMHFSRVILLEGGGEVEDMVDGGSKRGERGVGRYVRIDWVGNIDLTRVGSLQS
jgi:hypothetical protein